MRYSALVLATAVASSIALTACTNPTSSAGTMSSTYKGTIKGIEVIYLDSKNYDSGTNTLVGGIAGALIGGLVADRTTGALIGAGVGAAAGGLGSQAANRTDGLRLSLDSENGDIVVDVPFNCGYKLGQKVRIINSGSNGAQVQFLSNGAYHTATAQSASACQTTYNKYKQGVGEF